MTNALLSPCTCPHTDRHALSASHLPHQEDELELNAKVQAMQQAVHERLCDNVDTAGAMDALSDIIRAVNNYLSKKEAAGAAAAPAQPLLLRKAASYVTRILSMFGIVDAPADRCGWLLVLTEVEGTQTGHSAGEQAGCCMLGAGAGHAQDDIDKPGRL